MTCRSPFAFGLRQKLLQDQRVSAQVADRNYLLSNDYFLTDILQTLLFYKSFSVICIYDLAHNVIEDMKLLQHFDFFNLQNFILFLFSCIVWHSVFILLHYCFNVFYCHKYEIDVPLEGWHCYGRKGVSAAAQWLDRGGVRRERGSVESSRFASVCIESVILSSNSRKLSFSVLSICTDVPDGNQISWRLN